MDEECFFFIVVGFSLALSRNINDFMQMNIIVIPMPKYLATIYRLMCVNVVSRVGLGKENLGN